ncbi:hypothetical protein Ddye_004087, partial [Dipteronia dyeriana]
FLGIPLPSFITCAAIFRSVLQAGDMKLCFHELRSSLCRRVDLCTDFNRDQRRVTSEITV